MLEGGVNMSALRFAIQLELDGEKYYNEQAQINRDNGLFTVFQLLAEEERMHAEILQQYAEKEDYTLVDSKSYSEFESVFANMGDFSKKTKTLPGQIDAYRLALTKEQEMIDLYKEMHHDAETEQDKKLFRFLVEQEKLHYKLFDEIIQHLIKAEQWVEDAEFGIREEY